MQPNRQESKSARDAEEELIREIVGDDEAEIKAWRRVSEAIDLAAEVAACNDIGRASGHEPTPEQLAEEEHLADLAERAAQEYLAAPLTECRVGADAPDE